MILSSNKGQIFTPDFIVATVTFLAIMVMLYTHTENVYERLNTQEELIYYENLVSVTDLLLLYHGYPKYWNTSNVEVLGLAERPNYLNKTKVEMLSSMSDAKIKQLLGIEGMNFYFSIENSTDKIVEKGSTDWSGAENLYIVNRNAVMNGTSVKLKLLVW